MDLLTRHGDSSQKEIAIQRPQGGGMSGFARVLGMAIATTGLAGALLAAPAAADGTTQLVVDDDHAQCPNAEFETIQKAVDQATKKNTDKSQNNDVDLISVCPGLYAEHVSVKTPLTIRGVPEAISAIDCFGATVAPDPTQHAIVDGAGSSALALFTLDADNIELQGFVIQAAASDPRSTDFRLFRRGIETSHFHSGYSIHDNMIIGNDVGVLFRSGNPSDPPEIELPDPINVSPSNFDHNCLRDNGWGLGNDWLHLINARIHDNSTFSTENFAYEQTAYCPNAVRTGSITGCTTSPIGMIGVTFDHNISVSDHTAYRFASSISTTASDNVITDTRFGMRLISANQGLRIMNNRLEVREVGLARGSNLPSNFGVLIQGNTITGAPGLTGIGMGAGALRESWILDNSITGFKGGASPQCNGCGMAFLAGNIGNVVLGNAVTNNAADGIQVGAGATGNTFQENTLVGNGQVAGVDARDLNTTLPLNTWIANVCDSSLPATICAPAP